MAALSEKIIWPIVGIFIFGVIAGFYIDDRRRLAAENSAEASNQQASTQQEPTTTKPAKATSSSTTKQTASKPSSSSNSQEYEATSMSINEYLAQSAHERSQQLIANVTLHQGFSGSIEEYLTGKKPTLINSNKKPSTPSASSMSMEEYLAKTNNQSHGSSTSGGAYQGGIDEYLSKYGDGAQTPMKKNSSDPFNKKDHMGFHGSYEEYAKKYN